MCSRNFSIILSQLKVNSVSFGRFYLTALFFRNETHSRFHTKNSPLVLLLPQWLVVNGNTSMFAKAGSDTFSPSVQPTYLSLSHRLLAVHCIEKLLLDQLCGAGFMGHIPTPPTEPAIVSCSAPVDGDYVIGDLSSLPANGSLFRKMNTYAGNQTRWKRCFI